MPKGKKKSLPEVVMAPEVQTITENSEILQEIEVKADPVVEKIEPVQIIDADTLKKSKFIEELKRFVEGSKNRPRNLAKALKVPETAILRWFRGVQMPRIAEVNWAYKYYKEFKKFLQYETQKEKIV